MSVVLGADRPARLVIRRVEIHGTSSIDARRLADALVPAIERAFAHDAEPAIPSVRSRAAGPERRAADRAADGIATAVADRVRQAVP
jgi:hypothetical protein